MSKQRTKITILAFVLFSSLACNRVTANLAGPQGPVEALPQYADPIEATPKTATATNTQEAANPSAGTEISDGQLCEATRYLQVSSEITLQETNQFGTRACEYRLKISNTHPDRAIRFSIYQHDQDGYANTEKSHWMGNVLIEPDEEREWTGSIYIYTDKDANGPVMSIPEKLVGVFDVPECAEAKQDESFFEQIFIALDPVCSME